jgi:prolyl-tRNA synthetase
MEEVHTPKVGSIEAVCGFLKTTPAEMIKTLIYKAGDELVVAVVRGDHEVNDMKLAKALGAAGVELAGESAVTNLTGAAVGFAGPMTLAEKLRGKGRMFIDHAVAAMAAGTAGANKTDYHVKNAVPGRDFPLDGDNVTVGDIRNAVEGDTHGGVPLLSRRGIEVGHVFKLGTKYSEKLGAKFLDESQAEKPCIMGCYGIGINRIIASAIEVGFDANGCVLPAPIAPFEVEIVAINANSEAVKAAAEKLYEDLRAAGVDVLLDDRDARPGVKFKDADLLGIPVRLAVGDKGLADGTVELKKRTDEKPTAVPVETAVQAALALLNELRGKCQA